MADSKLADPRVDSASPPPHCAICLGTCKNKCRANSCMHEFCYTCLLEWSKIKAECPLCKQEFKSILHNIKSINEYDVHIVENIPVENNRYLDNASLIYLPPATPPPIHHYQFRTTLTVDSSGEHAIQNLLLHHPLLIGAYNHDRFTHRRRRGDTSTSFRRSVYQDNLWVYAPPDITGRYRDVSPSYYRNNPAARTRLVPWLNRELNALLHENTQHVMHLVDVILDHLLRHHICSYMFRSLLYEYLGNKTDHFIHEFYNFMRSPFDMVGYDRHVIYTERQQSSPIHFIDEVDVSDYDSDVILVSDTNNNQGQAEPVIIDLVETDSDEPIIVSEERNEPRCTEEENRKPILPLKLRIKNRHKSKEKRSRGKKRHRRQSSSSSTSSSSSSSSSSTEESSSDSDCDYKRYQQKRFLKKMKREKKKRKDYYIEKKESSENEDDIPLASFARKKKAKHNKHKSHTVTSEKKEKDKRRKRQECDSSNNSNADSHKEESSSSDESFYSEHKPYVKSKIREVRSDDKHNKAGPSSGRLRNTLKKEASTNLWYSRPSAYDSDSSDS